MFLAGLAINHAAITTAIRLALSLCRKIRFTRTF
jgi:hypothetical protein